MCVRRENIFSFLYWRGNGSGLFFNIRLAILNLFQQLLEDIAVANETLLSVCSLVVRDALVGGRWSNGISFMVLNLGTQNVLCLGRM